jgi:hypothetical protein
VNRRDAARAADPGRRATLALCGAFVVAGALVRLLPCWNDFWLDEIWSWQSARELASPLGVFTAIHHSNNHHLLTLLLRALGEDAHGSLARLPSFAAGVVSIALAGRLAARRGRLEAVFACLLTAACFTLVHFSSEARGYALAVGFALAALACGERARRAGSLAACAAFGLCIVLGFLSQLVFLLFWSGVLARDLARELPAGGGGWRRLLLLHLFPTAALLALAWVDLRHFELGGGNPTDVGLMFARTFGFSLGLPIARAWLPLGALIAALVFALGLAPLLRARDPDALLYAIAIVIAPALVFGGLRPQVIDVRYFVIGIALWLLLASRVLADAWRSGGLRRAAALLFAAAFVAGNGLHTAAFLREGRGGYERALRFMAERTPGPELVVGGDHDFRNGMTLLFYARRLPPGKRLVYLTRGQWPAEGPPWLVVHAASRPAEPDRELALSPLRRYRLAAEFDHAAISGFWWGVYRRIEPSSASTHAR